ncbi:putative glycosyl hydrolase, partial [Violaceomyces palustris]
LLSAFSSVDCINSSVALQEAGKHVIWSYAGATPPSSLLASIRQGKVAGVIFFKDNIDSNLATHIASLKEANSQSPTKLPLLLMTDQEGGQVRRLAGEPTLSAKQIGSSSDPATEAYEAGQGAAKNLVSNGMNLNLAPVVDVYRVAGDFDDRYGRSFSNDTKVVSVCGQRFVKGQKANGVASTVKHFPGLGAAGANENTDVGPVKIGKGIQELREVDEYPYIAAIAGGVELVMPSWAVYTQVDDRPAGMSPFWITTELRGRLGFQGVTISDAIEAGGLSSYGSDDGKRSLSAISAGMDLILASGRNVSQGEEIVQTIAKAINQGTIDADDFAASTSRISKLRSSL